MEDMAEFERLYPHLAAVRRADPSAYRQMLIRALLTPRLLPACLTAILANPEPIIPKDRFDKP